MGVLHKKESFLRIWSHLLKKSLREKLIFCAMVISGAATAFSILRSFLLYIFWIDSGMATCFGEYWNIFHAPKNSAL